MKILVCAHEAPLEPFDGFRGPVSELIVRLRVSHDVRVLAVRAPDQPAVANDDLTLVERGGGALGRRVAAVAAMARGRPRDVDRLAALLAAPLRDTIEAFRPDVVHVTSGRLAALAPVVRHVPNVLGAFDALHLNAAAGAVDAPALRASILRRDAVQWKRFEGAMWPAFDAVTVVSDEDAEALHTLAPAMRLHVIPAGVDAARFAPMGAVARVPGRIVFHGVMGYPPNVAAAVRLAEQVFPMVVAECPDASLVIAGRDPARAVTACARLPGVTVTGSVPDIGSVLSAASVYVAAMGSGTGVKNKLLEAAANGVPCVVTPLATRGLGRRLADAMLVGQDDRSLAELTLRVLGDHGYAARTGAALRDAVVAEHDWSAVVHAHESLYRTVVERRLAPAKRRA